MMNRPTFKLPAVIQRPSDSGRKRQNGAPLRRVLGSKRLHYFTASTPSRSQVVMTPDGRHDTKQDQLTVEGLTARNLSLDLGGAESPLIVGQKTSDLITPSPMSIVATPRAPHKYFDQANDCLTSVDSKGTQSTASSSPARARSTTSKTVEPRNFHSATRSGTRGSAFLKAAAHTHKLALASPAVRVNEAAEAAVKPGQDAARAEKEPLRK
eukprot:CAMPEP_0173108774 /NCGR_PEP_ID=MMETSP1102-20130122/42949_1 /TAXON_ID=49646 /ORGANISM="Geminigera sp., Strain Caron Lab Isolate" /LENGTH=210 /DNA_ID=CAMNT_0014007371 /DNA_START=1 /DNA_END=632 /DNA_ORIENTATION=+